MVKYELLKGTTAASVVLDTATRKGYDPDKAEVKDVADIGVSLATVADVEKLLDGVDLEKFEIDIYAGASNIALLAAVITVCEKKRSGPRKITWRYYCRSDWRTCFGRRISSSAGRIL